MITITTLADFYEGYNVRVICEACQRAAPLDLPALACRVGWQVPLAAVRPRMRCSVCRSKRVRLNISGFPDPSGQERLARQRKIAETPQAPTSVTRLRS